MNELYRHIGPTTDVPAGDIGVGAREIGYLFISISDSQDAMKVCLRGKVYSGAVHSCAREATGYGCVYFAQYMLEDKGDWRKTCLVSGAGNVAIYTIEKLYQLAPARLPAPTLAVQPPCKGINLDT